MKAEKHKTRTGQHSADSVWAPGALEVATGRQAETEYLP